MLGTPLMLMSAPWPFFKGDVARTGVNDAEQLTAGTINQMELKWKAVIGQAGDVQYSSPVFHPDGQRVYITSNNGNVYAFSLSSPTTANAPLWTYPTDSPIYSTPAFSYVGNQDGSFPGLFVGCSDGTLVCLDAGTGKAVWSVSLGGSIMSSPVLCGGTVVVTTMDGILHGVSGYDGTMRWIYNTTTLGFLFGSPAYDSGADRLIFPSYDGHLYAVNAGSGTLAWKYVWTGLGGARPTRSTPAIQNGLAHNLTWDGTLMTHQTSDGALVLPPIFSGSTNASSSPAVTRIGTETYVVSCLEDGRVVCYQYQYPLGGPPPTTPLWTKTLLGKVYASPAITNQIVFVGREDGNLFALDLFSGATLANWSIGGSIHASPAISQNTVFVATDKGELRAYGMKAAGYIWSGPLTVGMGSQQTYTIMAVDANGSQVWAYGGQADITITGGAFTIDPVTPVQFQNGTGSVRITFNSPPDTSYTLKATDLNASSVTGNYTVIVVAATATPTPTNTRTATATRTATVTKTATATQTVTVTPQAANPVAAGCYGIILDYYGGNDWRYDPQSTKPGDITSAITTSDLIGFSNTATGEKWAGGIGVLLKFNGTSWSKVTLSPDPGWVTGVSVLPSTAPTPTGSWEGYEGWVGTGAGMYHYDRETDAWAQDARTGGSFRVVKMARHDRVWAAGIYGAAIFYNGQTWQPINLPNGSTEAIFGLDLLPDGTGWAVTEQGRIYGIVSDPDPAWSSTPVYTGANILFGVRAISSTEAWAVGTGGTLLRYQNGTWSVYSNPGGCAMIPTLGYTALDFFSANDGWIISGDGTFLHWDGSCWGVAPVAINPSSVCLSLGSGSGVMVLELSEKGSELDEHRLPMDVVSGNIKDIYVADTKNDRIQIYSGIGELLAVWGLKEREGSRSVPVSLAMNKDTRNLYILDTQNDRIVVMDQLGGIVGRIGTHGKGPGQFNQPNGIALDAEARIWVADSGNGRIQVLDHSGMFLRDVGLGILQHPQGVALGRNGELYVADADAGGVLKFDALSGIYLGTLMPSDYSLKQAHDLCVGPDGTVYVADTMNNRIVAFSEDGYYLGRYGSYGETIGSANTLGHDRFNQPHGIHADDKFIYVADTHNNRIVRTPYENLTFLSPLAAIGMAYPTATPTPVWAMMPVASPTLQPTAEAVGTLAETSTPTPVPLVIISAQAAPNPFSPHAGETCAISFVLSGPASVVIEIYEKNGKLWRRAELAGSIGANSWIWDGLSDLGHQPPPGQGEYTVRIALANDQTIEKARIEVFILP